MISIIVPVYNGEAYLDHCIKSLINQTYKDLEIILVNDCSPDHSLEICNRYAVIDSRIKVVSNKVTSGTAKARNLGLNNANGEYISFVDDDDFVEENFYEIMIQKILYYSADIVQCVYVPFKSDAENTKKDIIKEDKILQPMEVMELLFTDQTCVVFNKLYRKKLFDDFRFDNGKFHEDLFIIHKILYNANKIVMIDYNLYHYRKTPNSITMKAFNKTRLDIIEGLEVRANFLKKIDNKLYLVALRQLADTLINTYYNMLEFFKEDKDDIYLIRSSFKRYYKIVRKYKYHRNEFTLFYYFPHIAYLTFFKKRMDYFRTR